MRRAFMIDLVALASIAAFTSCAHETRSVTAAYLDCRLPPRISNEHPKGNGARAWDADCDLYRYHCTSVPTGRNSESIGCRETGQLF